MNDKDVLQLKCEWISKSKAKVTAWLGEEVVFLDTINPASATARKNFIAALREKVPVLDGESDDAVKRVEALEQRLLDLAVRPAPATPEEPPEHEEADLLTAMPQDIRDEAEAMLNDRLLIQRIVDDIAALGVAGECELTATIYLIGVSRLLDLPLAAIVQGPSSSGKSYLIERTATLFPPETIIHATQMTPQALFHMRPGTLSHRFIVGGERSRAKDDEQAEATRALREMLSSGKLSKLMPMKMKGEGDRIETVLIEQDGPIAFIESTTLTKIFEEDANRSLLLNTDEQPKQTQRIIRSLAGAYSGRTDAGDAERIVHRHHALQRMLQRLSVIIPYAERLGELMVSDRVEARRAFPQVMSMIQAVTLLHQRQRQTDATGRLIATADDYHLARRLLFKPMARQLGGAISDAACRFYDRLVKRVANDFTSKDAQAKESSSKSAVWGWLHELHEVGAVELVEEHRGSRPARWRLTGSAPDTGGAAVLPTVEAVCQESTGTRGHKPELVTQP